MFQTHRVIHNKSGNTAGEYALFLAGIALVVLTSFIALGGSISNTYCIIGSWMTSSHTCSNQKSSVIPSQPTPSTVQEQADPNFIPVSMGGKGAAQAGIWRSEYASMMTDLLDGIKAKDTITNTYGLYNNGVPISATDYNQNNWGDQNNPNIGNATQNGNGDGSYNTMFQIKTSDGHVYNVQSAYYSAEQGAQLGYNNNGVAAVFAMDVTDSKTGQVVSSLYKNGNNAEDQSIHNSGFNP